MKTLIIYDSTYGNTQKIAESIGSAIPGETRVTRAGEFDQKSLSPVDLLVVGSPTQGGRPTQLVQELLANIPETFVKGAKVAAFDTRTPGRFERIFGYAADRIAASLTGKGGKLVTSPMAFFVNGKKGPIKDGELARASSWAKEIAGK